MKTKYYKPAVLRFFLIFSLLVLLIPCRLSAQQYEYKGVIHIHVNYSWDSKGTVDEAVSAAKSQGLDFIVITDHDTIGAKLDGHEKYHDKLLVIVGEEISTSYGHLLSFGYEKQFPEGAPPQEIIDKIVADSGVCFLAHPLLENIPWRNFNVERFTGIELWNAGTDVLDGVNPLDIPSGFVQTTNLLTSPKEKEFALFDDMTLKRITVAVGGQDAHVYYRNGNVSIPSYNDHFTGIRMRILLNAPLTGNFQEDKEKLISAFRKGNCYITHESSKSADGFSFKLQKPDGENVQGEETDFGSGMRLITNLPSIGRIKLYRNGELIKTEDSSMLEYPVTDAGVYRVSVYDLIRPDKAWILSNPIYVRGKYAKEKNLLLKELRVFPNPAINAKPKILLSVLKESKVTIEVFNISGEKVKQLVTNEIIPADSQKSFLWDAKNDNGMDVSSDVYTISVIIQNVSDEKDLQVIRLKVAIIK